MIMSGALSRIESGGMTAIELGQILSQFVGRPVTDRTGRSGYLVVKLEFASETGAPPVGTSAAGASTGASLGAELPSVFAAVQEQLGLRLEPRREPTEVLVIDSVEQPKPD